MTSLNGTRVLLTRSADANELWRHELTRLGAVVYSLPTLTTVPAPLAAPLAQTLHGAEEFDWLIFTSAAGVRYFHRVLTSLAQSPQRLPPVAAVGAPTAAAARALGFDVRFVPTLADGVTLAAELPDATDKRVLLARAAQGNRQIIEGLHARGAQVVDIVLYKTKLLGAKNHQMSALLAAGEIDVVVFASPSAVEGFRQAVDNSAMAAVLHMPVIALGRTTQAVLEHAHFQRILIAPRANLDGVIDAIVKLPRK